MTTNSDMRFCLTSDQDWTPRWAADELLGFVESKKIPLHVFRTNPCPAFDAAYSKGLITQGWHPNFLPNSSHGTVPEAVIAYFETHFPGCVTVRSHAYVEDTAKWQMLAAAGIRIDSQTATDCQEGLGSLGHWTGIRRFPVFFEDDTYFTLRPGLPPDHVLDRLFTPGLKIFDVHATFFACNTPSPDHYQLTRAKFFSSTRREDELIYQGRGTRNLIEEIVDRVLGAGFKFEAFPALAGLPESEGTASRRPDDAGYPRSERGMPVAGP